MGIIGFIIAVALSGLVVGAFGRLAVPGKDPMSMGMTILIGVGGSFIGGIVSRIIFGDNAAPSMILAVAGAALLVLLWRRRRPRVG